MTDTFAPETRLRARIPPLIDRITPASIGMGETEDITIDGFGLYPTSSVRLIQAGKPDVSCTVISSSPDGRRVIARVAANSASVGNWFVRVSVLGGNLLTAQQSSLELGTTEGWLTALPELVTLRATTDDAIDGRYSLALTTPLGGFQTLTAETVPLPIVAGQNYVVSGWSKVIPNRETHEFIAIQLIGYNASGELSFVTAATYVVQDDWAQASTVRRLPTADTVTVAVRLAITNAVAGLKQYLFDLLYLTQDAPVDITSTQLLTVEDRRIPTSIVVVAGSGQTIQILQPFPIDMTARVSDADEALPNVLVRLQAPITGPSGVWGGGITAEDVFTDDTGIANARQFIANTRAGSYEVTANVVNNPLPAPARFALTNTPLSINSLRLTGVGQQVVAGAIYPERFTVTPIDAYENPISGVACTLSVFFPQGAVRGTFEDGTGTATATSNAVGVATFPAFTAGNELGEIYLVATAAGYTGNHTFSVAVILGPPASVAVVSGDNQSEPVLFQFPLPLSVVVRDSGGTPVPAIPIRFNSPLIGPSCSFAGGIAGAYDGTTDSNGICTTGAVISNAVAGSYQVTANIITNPVSQSAIFNLTNRPGAVDLLLATGGTPQSAQVGLTFGQVLQARTTDAYGNAIPNIAVTFRAPVTGPSGAFQGGGTSETKVSGLDGYVESSGFTANLEVGSYDVEASMPSGNSRFAEFLLTNMLVRDAVWDEFGEYEFVNARGEGQKLFVLRGQSGRLMPQVEAWEETVPNVPGFRFLGARYAAREITLPCAVEAANRTGREILRQLARVLDPTLGTGSLRVHLDDNSIRQIEAVYVGGLDAATENAPNMIHVPLVFRTPDPYWTDGVARTAQAGPSDTQIQIVNDGDYETWPLIHAVGATIVYGLTLTNLAIGLKIAFNNLGNGRDFVIDCRPGRRTVVIDGVRNYQALTRDSELWPLVVGAQPISIAATNRPTITFTWARRFLSI